MFQNHSDGGAIIDLLEYADALYSYAIVLYRSQTAAEDLVHETYLRALRAMERLRPDSNIKSWLFTILRNIWLNQVRRARAVPEAFDDDGGEDHANVSADIGKDPYAIYVNNVEREQVQLAIQQLPLEFREIILLREFEELSYEEIATMLQCPVGTLMSRLATARSKLRDLLVATGQGATGNEGQQWHQRCSA